MRGHYAIFGRSHDELSRAAAYYFAMPYEIVALLLRLLAARSARFLGRRFIARQVDDARRRLVTAPAFFLTPLELL